jgi:hypothetical protein
MKILIEWKYPVYPDSILKYDVLLQSNLKTFHVINSKLAGPSRMEPFAAMMDMQLSSEI